VRFSKANTTTVKTNNLVQKPTENSSFLEMAFACLMAVLSISLALLYKIMIASHAWGVLKYPQNDPPIEIEMFSSSSSYGYNPSGIALVASMALWGNKMDLSLWRTKTDNANIDIFLSIFAMARETLLHDDTALLQKLIVKPYVTKE
jgi:hypothetical protein